MARIVARTWEWTGEDWNLVLDHVFYGRTRREAEHIMHAHEETDAFFRGCLAGRFRDFACHTELTYYD